MSISHEQPHALLLASRSLSCELLLLLFYFIYLFIFFWLEASFKQNSMPAAFFPHTIRDFRYSEVKAKPFGDVFPPLQLTFSVSQISSIILLVLLQNSVYAAD